MGSPFYIGSEIGGRGINDEGYGDEKQENWVGSRKWFCVILKNWIIIEEIADTDRRMI